ncbi:MAG: UTP--glucose-1-phosphate uridylyltransferase [Chloroflexi bacterium]|nr:UTP--glucose-1-phosphate uridylyltransferase [Chloroflexota bacterium]MBP7042655.1 UTP--glucose-1-phosphate uridylyltransferase [Chloroflexota bacterium]
MQAARQPRVFIETFAEYYAQLADGYTGLIPETDIEPVQKLPDVENFPPKQALLGKQMLAKTAVIKLNGGLGTSMGLDQAKSLLPVKDDLTFLDVIARQSIKSSTPLILMNSFSTESDSLRALQYYNDLNRRTLPLSFLQHKEPKITQSDLTPAVWPDDPDLEWCPPGHGDIYTALVTRGTLSALLSQGIEYAFVSNADNLGAVIDLSILGYMVKNNIPFLMEVSDRTEMDKKGGHLAQRRDGQLLLRESAQCPPEDKATFQDISRHRYFNTNNLWVHLPSLRQLMLTRSNKLGLPLICNSKTVDPRDPDSTPVYQLETAMGSAIAVFSGSQAVRVPRSRFAPVKKTDDLLLVRSDSYVLTSDFNVVPNPERVYPDILVDLDPAHYKFISDLDERFPFGPPSLVNARSFVLQGDFRFGKDVVCKGAVHLINESGHRKFIPDNSVLDGTIRYT